MEQRLRTPQSLTHTGQYLPDGASLFLLMVRRDHCGRAEGYVYRPSQKQSAGFFDLGEAILIMEELLNRDEEAEENKRLRSFEGGESVSRQEGISLTERELQAFQRHPETIVFRIRILYRQNSSWQGEISDCREPTKTCFFRSVLELISLIQSAKPGCDAGKE